MNRRDFITGAAVGVGAAWLGVHSLGQSTATLPALPRKFSAAETVTLGKTGIKTSLLAMGTGTSGWGHQSRQSSLGVAGLSDLLYRGYDQGLRFFDTADMYGSHPHVGAALKRVPREKVTVMTKVISRDAATAKADLDRFRKELGTDYLDLCLIHCVYESDWTERFRGVMDVLSEAKEKGIIRAHGVSCHSIGALRAAAKSPWVEIDLARINPLGSHMDASPETVLGLLRQMHDAGKGVIGMKILGAGDMRNRQDEAIRYALSLGILDAFTIGATDQNEQKDLIRRIAAA